MGKIGVQVGRCPQKMTRRSVGQVLPRAASLHPSQNGPQHQVQPLGSQHLGTGRDTGHGGPGPSRACSPAHQRWPQDAKAFFFFPQATKFGSRKRHVRHSGLHRYDDEQETREHVTYLTCPLRRHKCQHSKALPGAPVIFYSLCVQRLRPPDDQTSKTITDFHSNSHCRGRVVIPNSWAGRLRLSVVPESTATKAEIQTESKSSAPTCDLLSRGHGTGGIWQKWTGLQDGRCAEFRTLFPATPFTQGGRTSTTLVLSSGSV